MSSDEEDSEWQPEEATDDTDAQDSETAQAEEVGMARKLLCVKHSSDLL